jgi:hypothetical protein
MKSPLRSLAITVVLCLFANNRLIRFTSFYNDSSLTVVSTSFPDDRATSGPTFHIALMDKTCQITHRYTIGDLVMFISPIQPDQILIQRIVAKEGSYMYDMRFRDFRRIPHGHCWVQATSFTRKGENDKSDSYVFGPISIGLIQGRIKAIIWPLKDFRWINHRSSIEV